MKSNVFPGMLLVLCSSPQHQNSYPHLWLVLILLLITSQGSTRTHLAINQS